jgi:hypothetical protein
MSISKQRGMMFLTKAVLVHNVNLGKNDQRITIGYSLNNSLVALYNILKMIDEKFEFEKNFKKFEINWTTFIKKQLAILMKMMECICQFMLLII